jgi:hypothetical protein
MDETRATERFAELYRDPSRGLSPRVAWTLFVTAGTLADIYGDESGWDLLEEELPPLAHQHADETWMARLAQCFGAIAARLATGRVAVHQLTRCTGEEMALHIVIDHAESAIRDGMLSPPASLPQDGARDTDFDSVRDLLFRDHDVLLLFDPSLDGLDDPESELHQRFRFANLHPDQWFLVFADSEGTE